MTIRIDSKVIILTLSAVVIALGVTVFGLMSNSSKENSGSVSSGTPKMVVESSRYDFGVVSMADGLAKYTFVVKNEGTADLELSNINTSCMCTTAILDIDGDRSPKFGMVGHGTNPTFWSAKIKPGQSANLEVTYDPLAHGPDATGFVTRSVTLYSNDGGRSNSQNRFILTADVVK